METALFFNPVKEHMVKASQLVRPIQIHWMCYRAYSSVSYFLPDIDIFSAAAPATTLDHVTVLIVLVSQVQLDVRETAHVPTLVSIQTLSSYIFKLECIGFRRPEGCKCKPRRKFENRTCESTKCPCLRAGKECDPELCTSCCAR